MTINKKQTKNVNTTKKKKEIALAPHVNLLDALLGQLLVTTFLSPQSLLLKEGQRTERPLKVADETIFKFLEERKSAGVVDIWVLSVFYFLPLLEVELPLCYVSFQN